MFNNNWRNELQSYQLTCDAELSFENETYIPKGTIVKGGKKFIDKDYTTIFYQGEQHDFMDWSLKRI